MSEQLFDVVFFGILQAGKNKETVMQNMAALFKTDAAKLTTYFAGGRKVIKGKITAAAAEKYQSALENVGLVIKIERHVAAQNEPAAEATKAVDSNTNNNDDSITIAPVGADIIENPVKKPAQKIADISGISLAEIGADVLEHSVASAPAQKIEDISSLTVAEIGADVLEHHVDVIAQKIEDIADISVAEVGAELNTRPKVEVKADIADISGLSLDSDSR